MIDVIGTPAEGQRTWLVLLSPTRSDWPNHMTDDEKTALGAHFAALQARTARGQCVVAGPTLDGQIGLLVADGVTLPELQEWLSADAMVAAGYFDAAVRAWKLSLERGGLRS